MAAASRLLLLALALAGASCKSERAEPTPTKRPGFKMAPMGSAAPHVCTFGSDQSCNDDPMISSIHGTCNQDGTCTCQPGFQVSATTGRCK